jgi:outer membrane protein OmpA-like peptidoglycan-associated protein
MAPPEKRAIAPGTQPVRVDNIKAQSWADVHRSPPLVGQVFFVTNGSALDFEDMKVLDTLVDAYHAKLVRATQIGTTVQFAYYGYADYRYTKEHNYGLSQDRANAVRSHLDQRLAAYSSYGAKAKGLNHRAGMSINS